jgi:hypothetical protein
VLKKRRFNFLARFSPIDDQTDLLAHIVNPQFLTVSNHRLRGKRIAGLAVPSLVGCAAEGSAMSLRQSEDSEAFEALLPNGNLGISIQCKQHKKNKTPLTTLPIDADQMRNATNLLMCNIQSKGLCVRQGHTEANDQAFSFSN